MSTNLLDSLSTTSDECTNRNATGVHEESAVDLAVLQLVSSELGDDSSSAANRDVDLAVPAKRQRSERLRGCVASSNSSRFWEQAKHATALSLFVLSAILAGTSLGIFWKQASEPALESVQTTDTSSSERSALATIAIEKVQLGDRLAGRNPLREEVELFEPDPATWRSISLHLEKESGSELWVELLRPEVWLEWHDAKVGGTIDIDLPEMGAVGEALVTSIGPSPPIKPGTGTVVTGTFKHRADQNSQVIHLLLEDQQQPTGVTANHCYWSVDRREFVEAGHLRIGEQLDTEFGLKRVVSITPISHTGFLYNLETTEHVYRIDPLGTLVHNTCAGAHHFVPRALGSKTPYRHSSLTKLSAADHTKIHQSLNQFLKTKTKELPNGDIVDMMPRRGNSGNLIQNNFTKEERLAALEDFYKQYEEGIYLTHYLNELSVANKNNWIQ